MEKTKKIKIFVGLSYLVLLTVFLYLFFSHFSVQEITSYEFIKKNSSYFIELKKSNLFLVILVFFFTHNFMGIPFFGIWVASCSDGWFYFR